MPIDFADDLAAITRIEAIPTLLEVVCRTTGLGFAAVARVTETRWVACAVRDEIAFGLQPGGELQVETTLCDQIRGDGELIVIEHVAEDLEYREHSTPALYGFQSYISIPIRRKSGQFFGTLCAIDPKPARLGDATVNMCKLFAELIGFHLDAHDRVLHSERELLDERKTAELREQFIAVLGHDLRTPLGAIDAAASILQRTTVKDKIPELALLIKRSAARMAGLIDNVLDFARGRLGGGLALARAPDSRLAAILEQVVNELTTASPARFIESDIRLDRPVACDSGRIAQLLANLLGNALEHGDPAGVIRVRGRSDEDAFELSVSNRGKPIPAHVLGRLFEPFYRAENATGQAGLGLGLYIASEIARAHEGTLEVISTDEQTRFSLRVPAR